MFEILQREKTAMKDVVETDTEGGKTEGEKKL